MIELLLLTSLLPLLAAVAREQVHMAQLNGYFISRYCRWLIGTGWRRQGPVAATALTALVAVHLKCLAPVAGIVALGVALRLLRAKAKKPLVLTARVWRLLTATAVLSATILACWTTAAAAALLLVAAPCLLVAALTLLAPVEGAIATHYRRDATKTLQRRHDLVIVGITGSYGKTSTKNFLAAMLGERLHVLATPASFNTPMGITRTVREHLSALHNVFIAEMGARQRGDIAELGQMLRPAIGIITSIGPQHLETFGSLDTVYSTKLELADHVSDLLVVNGDDARLVDMAAGKAAKVVRCGQGEQNDFRLMTLSMGPGGSQFSVRTPDGTVTAYATRILGAPAINDILYAIAVASHLGIVTTQIVRAVAKLRPVEHRLQLRSGPFAIIDDAYNANPVGAAGALEVIRSFDADLKIVITPGMVELGSEQFVQNAAFARHATEAADLLIVVGATNRVALSSGDPARTLHAGSFDEAMTLARNRATAKSVVLLENDLPDNFG